MAKLSALDKVIRQYELELEMHERALETTKEILDRLREQKPVRKPRPRVVKPASEKTA